MVKVNYILLIIVIIISFLFYKIKIRPLYLEYSVTSSNNYKVKSERLRKMANKNSLVFLIGDSILESINIDNDNFTNLSIGGETTNSLYNRLENYVFPESSVICCMVGINDLLFNNSTKTIQKRYENLITTFISKKVSKIFFLSILPISANGFFVNSTIINSKVNELNKYISEYLQYEDYKKNIKIHFIDCHKLFLNSNKKLNEKLTYDGVHLNNNGKAILRNIIYNVSFNKK